MRLSAWVGFGLLALFGATGCNSAHIKDAYLARDEAGRRKETCFKPEWKHYFVFVEMLSYKEDTLLTPYLVDGNGNGVPIVYEDDELAEFGNIAPGKGDIKLTWEMTGPPLDPENPSAEETGPLQEGNFSWQFYLNDHSNADEVVNFTVAPGCE